MKEVIIFLVVVLLIGIAYYFVIKNKSGASKTSGNTSAGAITNNISTPLVGNNVIQQTPPIKKGDSVYINSNYSPDDVYVYTYPKADGLYLIGNTRHSWWGSQPIGKFVEMAGTDWAKINVSGFQIYTYDSGKHQFSTTTSKISQDVFVPLKEISNKPY